ncbi:polyamine ABC transporter substrate-binding protein, partial [Pseudomonas aeruginosa]
MLACINASAAWLRHHRPLRSVQREDSMPRLSALLFLALAPLLARAEETRRVDNGNYDSDPQVLESF